VDEKSKYTPGPWKIQGERFLPPYAWVIGHIEKNGERLVVASAWKTDDKIASTKDDETGQANAELIAAAPEMYEGIRDALKFVSILYERNDHGDSSLGTAELDKLESILEACLEKIK